jgi:orotidine-5'-phosphate decarboxylase
MPRNMDALLDFNEQIISHTLPYTVAYKLNTAFFEQYGSEGWCVLEETRKRIPSDIFTIADAKRGDIGNTSTMYARAFFDRMNFDAITVSPYMGEDSLRPFLEFKHKWVIVLALTSNKGSNDFQQLEYNGFRLYEKVLEAACKWGNPDNMMFVAGATQTHDFKAIRALAPRHFLLVPGVGAQGGSVDEVAQAGMTPDVGLLVNASRSIIYAGNGTDFANRAANEARHLQLQMKANIQSMRP